MIIQRAVEQYKENFLVSVSFGLFLAFVFFASFFPDFSFTSASLFFLYNFSITINFLIELLLILVFLFVYSLFLTVLVFSVHHSLLNQRIESFLQKKFLKKTIKVFLFNLFLLLLSVPIYFVIQYNGTFLMPVLAILLFIHFLLMFTVQSIVVEQKKLSESMAESIEFIELNFTSALKVFFLTILLYTAAVLVEFFIDYFSGDLFVGRFVSIFLATLFVMPFFEIMKTYIFMLKFHLIKGAEMN